MNKRRAFFASYFLKTRSGKWKVVGLQLNKGSGVNLTLEIRCSNAASITWSSQSSQSNVEELPGEVPRVLAGLLVDTRQVSRVIKRQGKCLKTSAQLVCQI